jgi:hypothetical protein
MAGLSVVTGESFVVEKEKNLKRKKKYTCYIIKEVFLLLLFNSSLD